MAWVPDGQGKAGRGHKQEAEAVLKAAGGRGQEPVVDFQ